MITKNSLPVLLLLLMVLIQQCSTDEAQPHQQRAIRFNIKVAEESTSLARTSGALPAESTVILSLKNASGRFSLTRHAIRLVLDGDQYVSDPVSLHVGRYVVDEFVVVDGFSRLLFATPRRNSSLASLVDTELPFGFQVTKGKQMNVEMDVVSVSGRDASEFGYNSFDLNLTPTIPIAVYINEGGIRRSTEASLTIFRDSIQTDEETLVAAVNYIPFEGDENAQYQLTIEKEGYVPFRRLFTYSELATSTGGTTVDVDLEPLGAYFAFDDQADGTIIGFNGPSVITFFDPNQRQSRTVAEGYDPDDFYTQTIWLFHDYQETTDRRVFLKGDVARIDRIMLVDGRSLVTKYTPEIFQLNLAGKFDELDFTNNKKLWEIAFIGLVADTLIMPADHEIQFVALYYNTSHVPYIIQNIYENAVRKNLRNGSMSLSDLDTDILANLGPEVQAMLDDLKTNYEWAVYQ